MHRWIGIFLCPFFAMWFGSGLVMVYVPYPSLSNHERLSLLETIDTSRILIPPSHAIQGCSSRQVTALRLITINRRPAYVCHAGSSTLTAVFADDGEKVEPLKPPVADIQGPLDYDQWIVHQRFDPYRPFYRHALDDEAGTQVYYSAVSGEVLQQTTRQQRVWNYLGAVAHWIYPTIIRKNWSLWDQLVWWLSLVGSIGVILGLYLGMSAYLRSRRSTTRNISPYRNWLRWHHILGLCTGFFVLSWIFSGWLSMDHGRLFSRPNPDTSQVEAFRGKSLTNIADDISLAELQVISMAKEITFHAVAGKSFLLSRSENFSENQQAFSFNEIEEGLNRAWPDTEISGIFVVPENDVYTNLREGRAPKGTYRAIMDNTEKTWVHVNPHNGEIISVMDKSRRLYRWLFNGLHSLDFPGLVDRRPLWDSVMILLLLGGLAFSITSITIAFRHKK